MIRARRARIVATLGPASAHPAQVVALARAGADVFRVNFSHGVHADHAKTIANVRQAEIEVGRHLAVLADLQGPSCAWVNSPKGGSRSRLASLSGWTATQPRATPHGSACRTVKSLRP